MFTSTFAFKMVPASRMAIRSFTKSKISMANPQVFFDIEIAGKKEGRIVFELYEDVVPKTAGNFLFMNQ